MQITQVGLTTAFLTLIFWPWFSFKGVIVMLPLWIGFEIFYRMRVRASVVCQYCGFDPFLYMVDVKRARREVESHWRKVFAEKGIPYPEKMKPGGQPEKSAEESVGSDSAAASSNELNSSV